MHTPSILATGLLLGLGPLLIAGADQASGWRWLAEQQDEDGGFGASETRSEDALALLALLVAEDAPGAGAKSALERSLAHLARAAEEGAAGADGPLDSALVTYALCKATCQGQPAQAGARAALIGLERHLADTNLSEADGAFGMWSVLALHAARKAELDPSSSALAAALGRVPLAADASGTWSAAEQAAAALLAHTITGTGDEPALAAAEAKVRAAGRSAAGPFLRLVGTWALLLRGTPDSALAPEDTLREQAQDGSWPSAAGVPGGRIGATAWALLTLEIESWAKR